MQKPRSAGYHVHLPFPECPDNFFGLDRCIFWRSPGIWRPSLYQLSYTPRTGLVNRQGGGEVQGKSSGLPPDHSGSGRSLFAPPSGIAASSAARSPPQISAWCLRMCSMDHVHHAIAIRRRITSRSNRRRGTRPGLPATIEQGGMRPPTAAPCRGRRRWRRERPSPGASCGPRHRYRRRPSSGDGRWRPTERRCHRKRAPQKDGALVDLPVGQGDGEPGVGIGKRHGAVLGQG